MSSTLWKGELSGRRRSSMTNKPNTSILARTLSGLSLKRRDSETQEEIRGAHGLNLLYSPPEPIVDFIFVHGLGGGSRKTWSKTQDSMSFWPKEWLPRDREFKHVRIHSFGYNSDWGERGQSALHIHDFGKSLLGAISDNAHLRGNKDSPIVFIGHSMGGLVVKKVCTLAQQDPAFQNIRRRIKAIYFLGTPHRGSGLAQTLGNIIRASGYGSKAFVADLHKQSGFLQSINDGFRHCVEGIQLFSFYETRPTNLVVGNEMIVQQDSATLGYPQERTALLNADHRGMTKFDSAEDPNFITVREAFLAVTESIKDDWTASRREAVRTERVNLGQFLTVFETPDDDLGILEELRAKGSCEWLVQEPSFRHWRDTLGPKFFWLHANPATGKSVLAAHVVNHLRNMNLSCSYFFFNHGDNSKCTLSSFLRSMAYQMALNNVGIRDVILAMQQDAALDKSDHRSLWRRLYLQGILQENFVQPHYWVIDALDECKNFAELIPLMAKVEESFPLRIFLTSRTSLEIQKYLQPLAGHLVVTPVSMFAVMEDIKLYVSSNTNELPWQDAAARQDLINKILEKSAGCFLWVKLVVEELSKIHGAADLKKVLEDVPPGMENLYHRTLKLMSTAPYGKNLAKAILTWTVCAARPLTVNELKAALLLDINDTFTNLEKSIISLCGQLVYIDSQSRVQVIHQTAKDFLLSDELESEFRVHKDDGNRRLAEACLAYLTDDEMKAPRSRRGTVQILAARSPFASYACAAFYHHINATHSNVHGILRQLSKFLGSSNVLTWIEINARNSTLGNLIGAAKTMKNYLQRRAKHTSPLGRDVQIVESWSTDLIRIVAKFGSNLLLSPASIYHLIPPFCPPETAPYKQFGETPRGLVISGLSTTSWDDCVSCITYGSDATASVACDDRLFAVGLVSGKIMIYNRTTCQKIRVLQHGELAKVLTFSASSRLLACSGLRNIRVWNILSGEEVFATKTTAACLALSIIDNDRTLLGAAKDNHLSTWDIFSGTRDSCVNWHESLAGQSTTTATRAPTVAAFSRELNLLGVVYRGEPILLWDLENDSILGYCGKAVQAKAGQRLVNTAVVDMVFNPIPATSLLAAAYQDGDLVLFDPLEGKILESVVAEAQNLASSPDGRTLASGNTSGTIQVYDFETLRVLYRINSWGYGIKSLAFSSDSLQFVDIRGSQCNVWEPSVLVRQNSDEEHSDSDAISTVTKEISSATIEELISITTMVSHPTMDFIFCGKDDGTVMLFESIYGKLQRKLYSHIEDISVTLLRLSSNVLVSADSSGRLMAHKLSGGPRNLSCNELLFDLSLERAITDVLLHPDLSCILISTPGLEMLLSMDGERINTHTLQPERTRKWCLHPIDHSNLIAAAGHRVEVYDWNLLHAGHTTPVSVLETSTPAVFHIEAVNQYPGSNHIGIKMSDPSATRSRTRTMLFEASMLEVEEDLSASTQSSFLEAHHQSQFRALERSIEHIFNYIGTRIIFLDRTGWICSVDLDMFTGDYYMRHFFIPSDWLSINPELIGTFTHRSDFTFAQRDEIAVVKRGFDYSEQVPLTQESTREEVGVRLTKAEEE